MGRSIKLGSLKRESRKTKFKIQDPFSRRKEPEDLVHNSAPKGDSDIIDRIPANFMLSEVPESHPWPSGAALSADRTASKKQARRDKKQRRLEQARAAKAMSAGLITHRSETPADVKLKQLPGESKEAFRTRVDLHMKTNLRSVSKKMVTGRKSEKKKERMEKAHEKKRAKTDQAEKDAELFKKGPKAAFNDVCERPPELTTRLDGLKTKSQQKAGDAAAEKSVGAGGGSSANAASSSNHANHLRGARDLSNYASQIRDAYASMKDKRLLENEKRQASFSPAQKGQKKRRRKEDSNSLSTGPSGRLREAIDTLRRKQEEEVPSGGSKRKRKSR